MTHHQSHEIVPATWYFDWQCKRCGATDDDLNEPCKEKTMGPIFPEGTEPTYSAPIPAPAEESHSSEKVNEFLGKVEHLAFLPVEVRKHVPDGAAKIIDGYLRMASWILVGLAIWTASTLAEFRGVATYEWLLYLSVVIVGIRFAARAGY